MWSTAEVTAEVVTADGEAVIKVVPEADASGGSYAVHLSGSGRVRDVRFTLRGAPPIREVFLTAPNLNGIMVAHPGQTLYQGMSVNHPDALFGPQWMFSPPPMVFPVRRDDAWFGVGLGAPPGRNHYSGWTYAAETDGSLTLTVHYDGYATADGHACSLLFFADGRRTPQEVIRVYAERLRALGWAPRPRRQAADWWSDTFFFPWGEQCNLAKRKGATPWYTGDTVTMYETQANQERWFACLAAHGVPVGTVCTSDKWQIARQRLVADVGKYPDLRGWVDGHHRGGRHVLAWVGLWRHDAADPAWCLRDPRGALPGLDPESEGYAGQLRRDVVDLLSPRGSDVDGFFLDFTNELPVQEGLAKAGTRWGVELLHHYLSIIHDAAKEAKPDALIMTHCPHPFFADVTDVLRLNDWSYKRPDLVRQARYRHGIASACSDWLINTDNWFMYDIGQWREYLQVQPELGIPASWYAEGVWGDGPGARDEPFTDEDYRMWAATWRAYRAARLGDRRAPGGSP